VKTGEDVIPLTDDLACAPVEALNVQQEEDQTGISILNDVIANNLPEDEVQPIKTLLLRYSTTWQLQ